MAIRTVLDPDGKASSAATAAAETAAATDRITIRLRPGDGAAIARRAAQREMKASTYLAALAHVGAHPPLAAIELATLKQSIVVLAGLGRLLAQTARNPALTGAGLEDLRQNLSRTRAAVAALEQHTHDLAKTALVSWESRSVSSACRRPACHSWTCSAVGERAHGDRMGSREPKSSRSGAPSAGRPKSWSR